MSRRIVGRAKFDICKICGILKFRKRLSLASYQTILRFYSEER